MATIEKNKAKLTPLIRGEDGNDVLLGGMGDDSIWGDASSIDASLHGDDFLDGGDGTHGGATNDSMWEVAA